MKFRFISAIALSAISINSLAVEGHGFKIISTSFQGSPGFGVVEMSSVGTGARYAQPTVTTYDAQGRVNEFIKIQSTHSVNLSNFTNQTLRYTYNYDLGCQAFSGHYSRTVDVWPNGIFHDNSMSYGSVQQLSEGNWSINAKTKIEGAENNSIEAHAQLKVRR